jgi:hypothetical protein
VRHQGKPDLVDLLDDEVEGGDDAEFRPGATHRPEKLAVSALVHHHH